VASDCVCWLPFSNLLAVRFNSRCSRPGWRFIRPVSETVFGHGEKSRPNFTVSTPRRLGLDFACVLARRAKSTRPRARLPASGKDPASRKTGLPQALTRPAAPPLHSPNRRSIPSAKFRRSAESHQIRQPVCRPRSSRLKGNSTMNTTAVFPSMNSLVKPFKLPPSSYEYKVTSFLPCLVAVCARALYGASRLIAQNMILNQS
jgi:hypothetical protein